MGGGRMGEEERDVGGEYRGGRRGRATSLREKAESAWRKLDTIRRGSIRAGEKRGN